MNTTKIKSLDSANMFASIGYLPRQIEQAWEEVKQVQIPVDYKKIKNVVINGMGGSGLGTHIIRSVYFQDLKVPVGNIHSYDVPGMVDRDTLYIISSYSGATEEPISTFKIAKQRGAKILGIAGGGKLADIIKSGKIPGYVFSPVNNPCNQPRIGIGYSVASILGLLKKAGVVKTTDADIKALLGSLYKNKKKIQAAAERIARQFKNQIPIVIAADFLSGNAHVFANQLNENAKNFSTYFIISELNHHLLEGLKFPLANPQNLHFIFLESDLYHPKNIKRIAITKNVLGKNKIKFSSYKLTGRAKLEQSFLALQFSSYAAFFLGMENNIDPSPIPWVDYLKEQLRK